MDVKVVLDEKKKFSTPICKFKILKDIEKFTSALL